jgi:PAS domain S-box-containing protein
MGAVKGERSADEDREALLQLSRVVEYSPASVVITDPLGTIKYVNPKFTALTGYTLGEVRDKNPRILKSGETPADVYKDLWRTITSGEEWRGELHNRKKNGELYWERALIAPVLDPEGRVISYVAIKEDITEQKVLDERLKQSEEKLKNLVEASPDAIVIADLQGRVQFRSPRVHEMFGAPNDAAIENDRITDHVAPESMDDARHGIAAVFRGEKVGTKTYALLKVDGARFVGEINASLLRDAKEEPTGMVAVIRDVTDKIDAERELRRNEERYRTLLEGSPYAVVISGLDDDLMRYVNQQGVRMLGLADGRVDGKRTVDFFERSYDRQRLVEQLTREGHLSDFELALRSETNQRIWVSVSATLTSYNDSPAIFAALKDITKRKKAEEGLKQANRKLGLLSSITRHDILNQITVLNGYIKLSEARTTDPKLNDNLRKMERAVDNIQHQIVFTRDYENVGVNAPEWQSLEMTFIKALSGSEIRDVITEIQAARVDVFADPMLEKVFYNLIDNSVRHGEKVTRIHLHTAMQGEDLIISYEDNGIGIGAADKSRLFQKGFGKNTGFGLFLTTEILDITGIKISETGTPGKGVVFELRVPPGNYRFV